MSSLVELCRRIEINDPPIEMLSFGPITLTNTHQCIDVALIIDKDGYLNSKDEDEYLNSEDEDDSVASVVEKFDDCSLNSPEQWRALGKAVAKCNTIERLELHYSSYYYFQVVKPETEECLADFYNGLKKSKSIDTLRLLFSGNETGDLLLGLHLYDLDHLLKINNNMTVGVECNRSRGRLTPDQISMVTNALDNNQVETLILLFVEGGFGNDQIISSCLRVKRLNCYCDDLSTFAAISSLITDPRASLVSLHMGLEMVSRTRIDAEHLPLLVTGLKNSHKLKVFYLRLQVFDKNPPSLSPFDSLIDTSSFESVCSSNSTLEFVQVTNIAWLHDDYGSGYIKDIPIDLPEGAKNFLATNRIENQKLVVQKKVGLFYMQGSFDVTPFSTMNIWLLPKVMKLIDRYQTRKLNAIFRLLRGIPELCNVKSREGVASHSPDTKRRKV